MAVVVTSITDEDLFVLLIVSVGLHDIAAVIKKEVAVNIYSIDLLTVVAHIVQWNHGANFGCRVHRCAKVQCPRLYQAVCVHETL